MYEERNGLPGRRYDDMPQQTRNPETIIRKQRDVWARPDGDPAAVRVCDILLELIKDAKK